MKHRLVYWLTYTIMYSLALLPMKVLFFLSDFIYLIVYHIVRYRLRIVRANLSNSFPEKSAEELLEIERKFYHYICDYLVEEVKTLRISEEEIRRRMIYDNPQDFVGMIEKHRGAFLMIPHYANFEWLMSLSLIMGPNDLPIQIYKPLHNVYLDEMFKRIRSRFGGINISKHSTARSLIRFYRENKSMGVGFITDQSPNASEAHYWTTFLNQDTVFMDGAEKLSKMFGFPVLYAEIYRIRRGYCRVHFKLITEFPKETSDGEITESFVRSLENTIRRDPPYWFWSHRRWKLKRNTDISHD